MHTLRKKAFTLTELLVVVIVLGVLSAVAVPKFTRILESRKTTEAQSFLEAVRTEQEKRCVLGKNYYADLDQVHIAAGNSASSQYSYRLLKKGMAAQSRSKDYTLRVPSYKDGRLCCEGPYCSKLNKDYPLCADLTNLSYDDECSAEVEETCADNPRQAKCCSATQKWDGSKCVNKSFCELNPDNCSCNPYQEKCCTGTQKWDGRQCVNKTFCELNPDDCNCNPYQAKCCNPATQKWNGTTCIALTECDKNPNQCICAPYAAAHAEECDENSCLNKPNQEKCCDTATQKWDGTKCVALTECDKNPNQCACAPYAAAHAEECDENSCTNKPNQQKCCDPATQKWDGSTCVALSECEINPNQEQCCDAATEKWDGSTCVALTECDLNPDQCACEAYAASHTEECDPNSCLNQPKQEKCCDKNTHVWENGTCREKTACEKEPNTANCCKEGEEWDGAQCVPVPSCPVSAGDPRTWWDPVRKKCGCPNEGEYYHNGACCSQATPRTNSVCWDFFFHTAKKWIVKENDDYSTVEMRKDGCFGQPAHTVISSSVKIAEVCKYVSDFSNAVQARAYCMSIKGKGCALACYAKGRVVPDGNTLYNKIVYDTHLGMMYCLGIDYRPKWDPATESRY